MRAPLERDSCDVIYQMMQMPDYDVCVRNVCSKWYTGCLTKGISGSCVCAEWRIFRRAFTPAPVLVFTFFSPLERHVTRQPMNCTPTVGKESSNLRHYKEMKRSSITADGRDLDYLILLKYSTVKQDKAVISSELGNYKMRKHRLQSS